MLYKKFTKQYLKIAIISFVNNINLIIASISTINNYKKLKKA